jgi:hypothetical protein
MEPQRAEFSWHSGDNNPLGHQAVDKLSLILLIVSIVLALPFAAGIAGDILRGLLSVMRIEIRFPSLDMLLVLKLLFVAPCIAIASGVLRAVYSRLTTGSFFDEPLMRTIGLVLITEAGLLAVPLFGALVMNRLLPD